jgi:hypothetical protein
MIRLKAIKPQQPLRQAAALGFGLVDVLVALSVFAVGFSGLVISSQAMQRTVGKSMTRNAETAYLQMLMAEVNPYRTTVETAYDVGTKTAYNLPSGQQAYYTRSVSSDATTADIKQLNLFLYRTATDTTPYRRLRKDMRPATLRYNLGATAQWRDGQGNLWEPWPANTPTYSLTAGSRRSGVTTTGMTNATYTLTQTLPNATPLTTGHSQSGSLAYTFLATEGANYQIALGFVDTLGATHSYTVAANGSTLETFDLADDTGGTLGRVVTKTYNVTPTLESGVAVIKLVVTSNTGGANANLASITLSSQ